MTAAGDAHFWLRHRRKLRGLAVIDFDIGLSAASMDHTVPANIFAGRSAASLCRIMLERFIKP